MMSGAIPPLPHVPSWHAQGQQKFQKPLSSFEREEETVAGKKNTGTCINSEIISPLSKFPVFKSKIWHPQRQNMKGDCICRCIPF
jgi:hypothetical protein